MKLSRYRTFIKKQPCLINNKDCSGPIEAHDVVTRGMGGRKDLESFEKGNLAPLCLAHHRGAGYSLHQLGNKTFFTRYGVNLKEKAKALYVKYLQTHTEGL